MQSTEHVLSAKTVREIFGDCLFKEGEDHSNHIPVRGITVNVGFHPGRIEGHKPEIARMLKELPDPFFKSKGAGWSFLNMCVDKHDHQWGEHKDMQELMLLGIACGYVRYCMDDKEYWKILPGGVPYLMILDDKLPE